MTEPVMGVDGEGPEDDNGDDLFGEDKQDEKLAEDSGAEDSEEEVVETRKPHVPVDPGRPTQKEIDEHEVTHAEIADASFEEKFLGRPPEGEEMSHERQRGQKEPRHGT